MASGLVKLYFGLPEDSCQNNWGVSICFLQFRAFLLTKTAGLPVFWFDHENLAEFEVIREAEDPNLDDRVFVLPEFYGQCYEYLKTIEVKIISPLVILQCYFWERQLPMRMNPTWSTILSGHYITVHGFRLHEEDDVRARVMRLGGSVRRVLMEKTSILLVKEFDQNDDIVKDALAENVNVVGIGWLDEIWDRAHTIENGENDFLCEELFSAFQPPEESNLQGIPVEDAKVSKWMDNITSQVSISTVRDSDKTTNQSSHSNNDKENTTPQKSENHQNLTTNHDVIVPMKTPQTSKIVTQDLNQTVDSLDEELVIDNVVMTQDLSGGAPSAVTVINCTPDLTDIQDEVVLDNSGNQIYDDEAERPKIDISDVNISFESDEPLPEVTEREIIADTLKSTSKRLEDFISSPTQRRLNKLMAETATQGMIVHQDVFSQDGRTRDDGDIEAEEISEVGMGQSNEQDDELSEVQSIGSDYQRYLERGAEFSPLASPIEKVPYEKRHFVYMNKKRKRVRIPSSNDSIMSVDLNNENDNFSRSKLKATPSNRLATALGPPIVRRFGHNIVWQDKLFNPNLEMTQQPVLPPTQYSQFLRDVNQRKEQYDSMRQPSNGHNC